MFKIGDKVTGSFLGGNGYTSHFTGTLTALWLQGSTPMAQIWDEHGPVQVAVKTLTKAGITKVPVIFKDLSESS